MLSRCRPQSFPAFLTCLGAALIVLAQTGPARAQAGSDALLERARALADTRQFGEAEKACAEALKQAEAGGDALLLCRCRNQLADMETHLLKFQAATAHLAANREALRQLIAQRPSEVALRLELARTCEMQGSCAYAAGRKAEAVVPLREAIDLVGKLSAEDPARPEYAQERVKLLTRYGGYLLFLDRFPDAEAVYEEAIGVGRKLLAGGPAEPKSTEQLALACNSYALLVRESGQYARAAEMIREGIGLLARLEAEHPDKPEYWYHLSTMYRNLAQPLTYLHSEAEAAAARREADRADARLARVPEAARKWLTDEDRIRASVQNLDGERLTGQQVEIDRLTQQWEKGMREHPDAPLFRVQLATARSLLGLRLLAAGSKEPALRALRESLELNEKLVADFPEVPAFRVLLAESCYLNGGTALVIGNPGDGDRWLRQGQEVYDKLARETPDDPQMRHRSGEALVNVALTMKGQGDAARTLQYFTGGLAVVKQLAEAFPKCPKYRREAAESTLALGHLLLSQGDRAGAEARYREGIQLWRQVVADFPAQPVFRRALGDALALLCGYLYANDRLGEVRALYAEMIGLHEKLVNDFPREAEYRASLAGDYTTYGRVLERQEQLPAAAECYARTIVCLESALQLNPRQRDWLNRLRLVLQDRAYIYQRLGRRAEHEADMQRAQELDERLQPAVVRLSRIGERLADMQTPRAMKEAEDVFAEGALSGSQWYDLAGLFAKAAASTADTAQQDAFGARAVESLQRARDEGYTVSTPLAQDAQFRVLAPRPDFQKLAGIAQK